MNNSLELRFPAIAENEAFARAAISAFLLPVNPTLSTISEIRTAISEAVTNVVVHAGYPREEPGDVWVRARLDDNTLTLDVEDHGCGIADIKQAMQPFFTSRPEQERSGMGFSLMQSFMDGLTVSSKPGKGTRVTMTKLIQGDLLDAL